MCADNINVHHQIISLEVRIAVIVSPQNRVK